IEDAVAVRVAADDGVGMRLAVYDQRRSWTGTESAAAVAEKDRDVRRRVVGDGEVLVAVAVEVADEDLGRIRSRRKRPADAEPAAAVAEEHRHVVRPETRDDEVHAAVAVEVARAERLRSALTPEVDARRRPEGGRRSGRRFGRAGRGAAGREQERRGSSQCPSRKTLA